MKIDFAEIPELSKFKCAYSMFEIRVSSHILKVYIDFMLVSYYT